MIFIASDQTLVNLNQVTHVKIAKTENMWKLTIFYVSGAETNLLFSSQQEALTEYDSMVDVMNSCSETQKPESG